MGSSHIPPLCFPTHEPKLMQNSYPNCSCSQISPLLPKCPWLPTMMWAKALDPCTHPCSPISQVHQRIHPCSPVCQVHQHTHPCSPVCQVHRCTGCTCVSLSVHAGAAEPIEVAPSWPAHQPEDEVDGKHGGHATKGQPLQDSAAGAGAEALLLCAVHRGVQEEEHIQRGEASTIRCWLHGVRTFHRHRCEVSPCNTEAGVWMEKPLFEKGPWLLQVHSIKV